MVCAVYFTDVELEEEIESTRISFCFCNMKCKPFLYNFRNSDTQLQNNEPMDHSHNLRWNVYGSGNIFQNLK